MCIMTAYFTRTYQLIKELIIYTKVYQWLAVKWLTSRVRRFYLNLRHVYLLKLFKGKLIGEVYLALNDPYSFMLVQVLADLKKRFDIDFTLYMTHGALISFVENKRLWRNWALKDANDIAALYGLKSIEQYPSSKALATGQQLWQMLPTNVENAELIFDKTWADDFDDYFLASTPVITHQVKNLSRQINKGHELSASIHCFGDWFYGIDSLEHLEKSLNQLGFNINEPSVVYQRGNMVLPTTAAITEKKVNEEPQSITAYLSIRSPFSYLGLIQAKQLSELYQVPLNIKLVLPLMMRGVDVSNNKARYIFLDAYREAKQRGIPFKGFKDPLGAGVLNSYQIFPYAEHQNKQLEYMQAIYEAVFVNQEDLAKEAVIVKICQQINLDYQAARTYANNNNWQEKSDLNQQELHELGYWGVPCFQYQQSHCWGQDRLLKIQQAIENQSTAS